MLSFFLISGTVIATAFALRLACRGQRRQRPLAAWSLGTSSRRKGLMQSRRKFLRAAAATVAMPFAGISPAAATQRTILNDASRLSPTPVVKHATIAKPGWNDLIERIRAELKEATASKRPVAASVARHSMGGQSLPRDGTAITLDGGALEMDTAAMTYRTSAGNRWWDVIRMVDPKGFSPAVMQSNSDFGVGSTFCVNAHGWPVPHGPFA